MSLMPRLLLNLRVWYNTIYAEKYNRLLIVTSRVFEFVIAIVMFYPCVQFISVD